MKKKEDEKRRLEDKIGSAVSIIAPSTKFKGTIMGQDTLFISGHFKGEIKCEGLVRVDKQGRIEGMINSPYVIIEGEIKGDIKSAEHVELREEARVVGNINTAKIVMAEGCTLQGEVQMPKEGDKPFVFVEKRKSENQQINKDKSLSSKAVNKSKVKSGGPSKQKPS